MPDATVASVALAIETALQSTLKASGGPFALVDHWAGPPSGGPQTADDILALMGNRTPAAFIAFDDEQGTTPVHAILGDAQTRGRSQWAVIVATRGAQAPRRAETGPNATGRDPGVYELLPTVEAAINGLPITSLWHGERLRFEGTRWFAWKRGQLYALVMRFHADLVLAETTGPTPLASTLPALHIDGNVNLVAPDGDDVEPITQFSSDP